MFTCPDKYSSNLTTSTMNRGVEAKETEIANTQLGGDAASRSCSSPASPRDCASYLQVVVEKHRQRADAAGAAPRPPHASSPAPPQMPCDCGAGDGAGAGRGAAAAARRADAGSAECVEVYRFLRVGRALGCSAGGGGGGAVRRRARRWAGAARALAGEAGAAARLAVGAPLAAALLALRWTLQLARDAAQGALHAASDYTLKPALALLFNALLHPLLVFLANLLQGAREATRPLCGALGECAAHAATVLAAVRVVEVRAAPAPCSESCTCARLKPADLLHTSRKEDPIFAPLPH